MRRRRPKPSPAQAARRLRKLARHLRALPPGEYHQGDLSHCVLGHTRRLWPGTEDVCGFLRLSLHDERRLIPADAAVSDPVGKARQLEAIARRLERLVPKD